MRWVNVSDQTLVFAWHDIDEWGVASHREKLVKPGDMFTDVEAETAGIKTARLARMGLVRPAPKKKSKPTKDSSR